MGLTDFGSDRRRRRLARLRAAAALALLAPLVVTADARAFELEGASLEVDLTTDDRALAVLVLALPQGLEGLELTWLELGGAPLELVDARLLGPPGAPPTPVSPIETARGGPRPRVDLTIPIDVEAAESLQLSYRTGVAIEGPVTVPIPAPHALLQAGTTFEIQIRIPADRALGASFPTGLRETTRARDGALYRTQLPVVPSMLRFHMVPADRWWSVALLVDLAVAAIVLGLVAIGWRRFAGTR